MIGVSLTLNSKPRFFNSRLKNFVFAHNFFTSFSPSAESSSVSHLDCAGPVTVLSKTQTATGDSAVYDKPQNKIWIFGHVTLSDRGNVTKGDKLTYDLTSGQATVDTGGTSSRVKGLFLPGSSDDAAAAKPKAPN